MRILYNSFLISQSSEKNNEFYCNNNILLNKKPQPISECNLGTRYITCFIGNRRKLVKDVKKASKNDRSCNQSLFLHIGTHTGQSDTKK